MPRNKTQGSFVRSIVLEKRDLLDLTQSSGTWTNKLLERIRNELKYRTFDKSQVAKLVWTKERSKRKRGKAVLVSFYNKKLNACTNQLAFRVLLNDTKTTRGVLLTHWCNTRSGLKPVKKYFTKATRKNGYKPELYVAKELIVKYVKAFIASQPADDGNNQFNEENLCERFFGSFEPPLIANSNGDIPARIDLKNVIETDGKETNVHMFSYNRKLSTIGKLLPANRIFMHWGVIFKFEKKNGDVYWTLDGGRGGGVSILFCNYVVHAHRALPNDIDTKMVGGEKTPLVEYHGLVQRLSRREVIRIAKNLMSESYSGRYKWLTRNCQEWVSDLLVKITSTHDRIWYGPKTLENWEYDKFGNKKDTSTTKPKKKAREESAQSDRSCEIELVGYCRNNVIKLTAGSEETYEKLLIDIRSNYDVAEEKFNERRLALLSKLDGEIEVRFVKLQDQTVEESYSIQSRADGLTITRSSSGIGLVPLDKDSDMKTGLSVRVMFEWCVRMHRWLAVSDEKKGREYSSERFAEKFIKSLGPQTLPKTAKETLRKRIVKLAAILSACFMLYLCLFENFL